MMYLPRFLIFTISFFGSGTLLADIAVVVNKAHSLNQIRPSVVRNAFLGRQPIMLGDTLLRPLDLPENSAVRVIFYRTLARRNAVQMHAYWSSVIFSGKTKKPLELSSDDEVKRLVASNPGFIGYIDARELDDSVKSVLLVRQ